MGGVARAGTRAPLERARSARERRVRGFEELHPDGGARGETRFRTTIAQVSPKACARIDSPAARIMGVPAN
eukprot:6295160-Pyramimonas_sp.AAC.1